MSQLAPRRVMARSRVRGITLIELMVAMLLGLLVVGGAIGMFVANKRTYTATESLGRIQEGGRIGFELLARDVREADGTPCRQPQPAPLPNPVDTASSRMLPVANLLSSIEPWKTWGSGVLGYEGGGSPNQLAGTDAIELRSANTNAVTVASFAAPAFTLSTPDHGFEANDVVMVCDENQATIFQIGAPAGANVPITATGNCGTGLGLYGTTGCGTKAYTYSTVAHGQAMMARLHAVRWYVGANGRGGNSLWQQSMGAAAVEIIDGVRDLELTYLLPGAITYVNAAAGTPWKNVKAVRIVLELEGQQGVNEDRIKVGTDGQGLRRQITHVVTLRNRNI